MNCYVMQMFTSNLLLMLKVTAFAEQSYSYYSGNDGTDKDPQVFKSFSTTVSSCLLVFHSPTLHCSHYISQFILDSKWNLVLDRLPLWNFCYLLKASGAYVFRPNGTFPIKSEGQVVHDVLIVDLTIVFTNESTL